MLDYVAVVLVAVVAVVVVSDVCGPFWLKPAAASLGFEIAVSGG
jgi:hypothetical protein